MSEKTANTSSGNTKDIPENTGIANTPNLMDATFEGIILYHKGIIIEANETGARFTGYKREELTGKNIMELISEDCRQDILNKLTVVAENPDIVLGPYESVITRKDGSKLYVEIHSKKYIYNNIFVRLVGFRDITERKIAEEDLIQSEERFRNLFDATFEGIIINDDSDIIIDANINAAYMFGYDIDKFIGKHVMELVSEESHEEVIERNIEISEKPFIPLGPYEVTGIKKNGSKIILEVRSKGLLLKGKPVRVAAVRDITRQKRENDLLHESEKRLRKMNDVLLKLARNKNIGSGDLDAAFADITEAAAHTLDVEYSGIWLADKEFHKSRCNDFYQKSIAWHEKICEKIDLDDLPMITDAIEHNRIISFDDVNGNDIVKSFYDKYCKFGSIVSAIMVPVQSAGQIHGVLSIDHSGEPRKWTNEEKNFARSLGDLISISLAAAERLKVEKQLERRIEVENFLSQLSTESMDFASVGFDQSIYLALRKTGKFFGLDRCFVFQFNEDLTKMHKTYTWFDDGITPLEDKLDEEEIEQLEWMIKRLKSYETIYIPSVNNLPDEADSVKKVLSFKQIKSLLIIPLIFMKKLYGIIGFDSTKKEKEFSPYIISVLETVSKLVSDILEHKRNDEELKKANRDLEQKVAERTKELKQKHSQLVQTEKMASLGNLVAGVAHEINTPLGALKSNNDVFIRSVNKVTDILKEKINPEDSSAIKLEKLFTNMEKLNNVNKTATERIVKIVSSLRTFARLDQAEKDTVDIRDGIESTLTLVHHEIKNRIQVNKEYGPVPKVDCFPNQLNQVFMNILVNASQAIAGKGEITIKTYRLDYSAVVEISDTGKGISKENLKHIFDPGFTTKGVGVGTGLGLSIVYQIIKDHRGDILVESEPGKGSTFKIILPI